MSELVKILLLFGTPNLSGKRSITMSGVKCDYSITFYSSLLWFSSPCKKVIHKSRNISLAVQVVWSSVMPSEKVDILSVILGYQNEKKRNVLLCPKWHFSIVSKIVSLTLNVCKPVLFERAFLCLWAFKRSLTEFCFWKKNI